MGIDFGARPPRGFDSAEIGDPMNPRPGSITRVPESSSGIELSLRDGEAFVAMCEHRGRLYVAATRQVFYYADDGVLYPVKIRREE